MDTLAGRSLICQSYPLSNKSSLSDRMPYFSQSSTRAYPETALNSGGEERHKDERARGSP